MSFLFIDPACPKAYTSQSLNNEPLGGTEATVIRVAEGLDAKVMQHNRTSIAGSYTPIDWQTQAETYVVLRSPDAALEARKHYRNRPIYLWLHDLPNEYLASKMEELKAASIEVICVSQFHRHVTIDTTRRFYPDAGMPKIRIIHNPIADQLQPDGTAVNQNKLVFFSSPHKGLKYALESFALLREGFKPDLELFIANPGYLPLPPIDQPGVSVLGSLTHAQAMQHVREAFCVWYPNHVFAETFGLVFAEANAVGTPVLTHGIGAAREVLGDARQLVDTRNRRELIDRFLAWQEPHNRPCVIANPKFRLSNVLKQWKEIE